MLRLECSRILPDGRKLTGTMYAASAHRKYPIKYAGALDRLGDMPKSARPAEMELLFLTAVHQGEVGGGVNASGQYDYGPKYSPDDRLMAVQRNRERYREKRPQFIFSIVPAGKGGL